MVLIGSSFEAKMQILSDSNIFENCDNADDALEDRFFVK